MNAYVLVGGRSLRMGRAKSELFLAAVAAAARQAFDRVLAVQVGGGEPMPDVETIFEAPHPDAAPIFGVVRAIEHAGARCAVLAVDYPHITAPLLRFLRQRIEASAAATVVPEWDGRQQILCAGYDPAVLPELLSRIAARRYDLKGLPAEIVAERELRARFGGEPLMNVNTPAELEQARRIE
jgi:molybdopterin-guanine dinucleotide biosynthesis protein A